MSVRGGGGVVSAPRGMVSAPRGVCSQGVSAPGCLLLLPGGVCSQRGCLLQGGVYSGGSAPGGSAPRGAGGGVSAPGGGGIPACTEADAPRVIRKTNRCKNITLATTSLRPVTRMHSSRMRTVRTVRCSSVWSSRGRRVSGLPS